jgi:hypothetical protein
MFVSRFSGYYIRRRLQSLITLPITSHEPATTSGSSSAPSWRKPLLRIFRDELLVINSYSRILNSFYSLGDPLLSIVCLLARYMRAYRPLLSCNNSPLLRLRGYLAYRTVRRNLVVSVAWQWLFSALGNSAFQATCHIIIPPPFSYGGTVTTDTKFS